MEYLPFLDVMRQELGWSVTLVVLGITLVAAIFSKRLATVMGKLLLESLHSNKLFKQHKVKLSRHPIFLKYRLLINQRLKFINCRCELRSRIFCELMMLRIQEYQQLLSTLATRNDLNQLSRLEFQFTIEELLLEAVSRWRSRADCEGIPNIVSKRFLEATWEIRQSLLLFVKSASNSTYTYQDNTARAYAIFDMLLAFEESILMRLEESLDEMNGEISSCNYKGIECRHCKVCQAKKSEDLPE